MKRLLLAAVLALLPSLAQAQSTCTTGGTCTPIAKMACGTAGAAFPTCGADSLGNETHLNVFWSRSYQTGVGPNGEDAYRITHIGTTDTAQEYYHMGLHWGVPAVGQNTCRYFREMIRFNAPIDWNDDAGGRFGMKHVMWGQDGTNDSSRGIYNLRSDLTVPGDVHEPSQVLIRVEKNVDGGNTRTDVHDLTSATWYYVQIEMCTSVTSGSSDASIKVWVNNNTYASPTAQNGAGFAWPALDLNLVRLGFYGESLGVSGDAQYDIAKFEYDDQFSTNWNGANETGGGVSSGARGGANARARIR